MEPEKTQSEKFDPKISAVLSYVFPPLSGLFFLIFEKENTFVRFHAYQSMLFGSVAYFMYQLSRFSLPALFGVPVTQIVFRATILILIITMLKAYAGDEFELPVIGKFAKDQSRK